MSHIVICDIIYSSENIVWSIQKKTHEHMYVNIVLLTKHMCLVNHTLSFYLFSQL